MMQTLSPSSLLSLMEIISAGSVDSCEGSMEWCKSSTLGRYVEYSKHPITISYDQSPFVHFFSSCSYDMIVQEVVETS